MRLHRPRRLAMRCSLCSCGVGLRSGDRARVSVSMSRQHDDKTRRNTCSPFQDPEREPLGRSRWKTARACDSRTHTQQTSREAKRCEGEIVKFQCEREGPSWDCSSTSSSSSAVSECVALIDSTWQKSGCADAVTSTSHLGRCNRIFQSSFYFHHIDCEHSASYI